MRFIKKITVVLMLCTLLIIPQTGCSNEEPVSENQFLLDTVCTLTVYGMGEADAQAAIDKAFECCRDYDLAKVIGDFGLSPLLAFPLVLVMGCAFGAFMGLLIDALKIPAFIITLAGMFFLRGVSYLVSEESIPINHPVYDTLSSLAWKIPGGGRLSAMGLLMLAVVVIGIFLAHRTRFGNQVYAIGGNATSANLMGISTRSTTIRIYMLSTGLATLAGIVFSIYTQAGYALAGVGVELDAIASVVIGGTLLSGGVGTVLGTLFGVAIQGLIQTYINFDGTLSSWWTKIAIGILLFIFIALQRGLTVLWENRQSSPVTRVNIAQQ